MKADRGLSTCGLAAIAVAVAFIALVAASGRASAAPPVRTVLPSAPLVSLRAGPPLSPQPGALLRQRVDWDLSRLDLAAVFNFRHIVAVRPGLSLEIVFDAPLDTYPGAVTLRGHVAGDGGSRAVLTWHQSQRMLTIDSARHGFIRISDEAPDGDVATQRDLDYAPPSRDDAGTVAEQIAQAQESVVLLESEKKVLECRVSGIDARARLKKLAGELAAALAEAEAANPGCNPDAGVAFGISSQGGGSGRRPTDRPRATDGPRRPAAGAAGAAGAGAPGLPGVNPGNGGTSLPGINPGNGGTSLPGINPGAGGTSLLGAATATNIIPAAPAAPAQGGFAISVPLFNITIPFSCFTGNADNSKLDALKNALEKAKLDAERLDGACIAGVPPAAVMPGTAIADDLTGNFSSRLDAIRARIGETRQIVKRLEAVRDESRARNPERRAMRPGPGAQALARAERLPLHAFADRYAGLARPVALRETPDLAQLAPASPQAASVVAGARPAGDWIKSAEWDVTPACTDAPGHIEVAAIVSKRVWEAEIAVRKSAGKTNDYLEALVIDALANANTALIESNISRPEFDVGFRLASINTNAPVIDGDRASSMVDAWQRNYANEALFERYIAPAMRERYDVVLMILAGDGRIDTARGYSTITAHANAAKQPIISIVKAVAALTPEIYSAAHELGHILGAGHDASDSPAGKADPEGTLTYAKAVQNLRQERATLMAVTPCPRDREKGKVYSCRRLGFYSNQDIRYPGPEGEKLGDIALDNAGAMRPVRARIARNRCAIPMDKRQVWLRPPAQKPDAPATGGPILPAPWETDILWRRQASDAVDWRRVFQHERAARGSKHYVGALVANNSMAQAQGTLHLWKIPAVQRGRLLSPDAGDLVALTRTHCAALEWYEGRGAPLTLTVGRTTIVETPCSSDAFGEGDEAMFAAWSGDAPPAWSGPLIDIAAAHYDTAWRNVTDVMLGAQPEVETVILRNRTNAARQVTLEIAPAPRQRNFKQGESGLSRVLIKNARRFCQRAGPLPCGGKGYGTGAADEFFVHPEGATFELTLPPGPGLVLPVDIEFVRIIPPVTQPPTEPVPQTDVAIRVRELAAGEALRELGGATFLLRNKR